MLLHYIKTVSLKLYQNEQFLHFINDHDLFTVSNDDISLILALLRFYSPIFLEVFYNCYFKVNFKEKFTI